MKTNEATTSTHRTRVVDWHSPKGGQGCTTLAVGHAAILSYDHSVLLASQDHDAGMVAGISTTNMNTPQSATKNLSIATFTTTDQLARLITQHNPEVVVIDRGTNPPLQLLHTPTRRVMALQNCYLALRAALEAPIPHDTVVIAEPDRPLQRSDVEATLDRAVIWSARDVGVSRSADAGLLATRVPRAIAEVADQLASTDGTDSTLIA